jgi:phage recombination protein Bet
MNAQIQNLIRRTICKNASEEEFNTFLYLAQQYNLDPIKKEIYFIKFDGRPASILTGRDGYLKIAHDHGQFDGLESDAVYLGDKLTKRADGSFLIEYGDGHLSFDKTKLRGAFCNVFRKDWSKSTSIFVSYDDYYKTQGDIWKKYPNAMITKVAESMALKRAFSISGITTKEEILSEDIHENVLESKSDNPRKDLKDMIADKGIKVEELLGIMGNLTGKTSSKELTDDEVIIITEYIRSM